jgi:hypothetical protein
VNTNQGAWLAFPTFGGKYLAVTSPKKILEREKIKMERLAVKRGK